MVICKKNSESDVNGSEFGKIQNEIMCRVLNNVRKI